MPYWPGYSDISPRSQAAYLDWLASGRSDTRYGVGYVFLYFYGLERRILVDQSNEDADAILAEVERLLGLYPDNRSVQRYLTEFLDVTRVARGIDAIEPILDRRTADLPLPLKAALGVRIDRGEALSADWILSWLLCHPERSLRTPATRCEAEFQALFRRKFRERFPDGLHSRPAFAGAMVRRLAFRVREEPLRAEIMSIRSARERTFAGLASLGQDGTVTAFAARIGLTQEACCRALAALLKDGQIVRTGRGR